MKYTLLELVQSVLTSIDGDEVNSITDTTESMDCAKIIKDCYFDIVSKADLPEHSVFFGLEPSLDVDKPTIMFLPSNIKNMEWLKYDTRKVDDPDPLITDVKYMTMEDFFNTMYQQRESESNVLSCLYTVGGETVKLLYRNDKGPQTYTVLSDRTILLDSYDVTVEATLQKSKSYAYGEKIIEFILIDSYIPDLDERQFPLLLNEAKATAWAEKKQASNARAEKKARQGWAYLQRTKHDAPDDRGSWQSIRYNFGRN